LLRFAPSMALAIGLMTAGQLVFAGGGEPEWEDDDHAYDRARRAVESGESLPIAELLARVKKQIPGEVVGVEFERKRGKWMYEFKLIDGDGRLLEVYVDAQTGTIISIEQY
jgi:uncharacterized membrane protein YkoI